MRLERHMLAQRQHADLRAGRFDGFLVISTGASGGAEETTSSAVIIFVRLAMRDALSGCSCHSTWPVVRLNSSPARGGWWKRVRSDRSRRVAIPAARTRVRQRRPCGERAGGARRRPALLRGRRADRSGCARAAAAQRDDEPPPATSAPSAPRRVRAAQALGAPAAQPALARGQERARCSFTGGLRSAPTIPTAKSARMKIEISEHVKPSSRSARTVRSAKPAMKDSTTPEDEAQARPALGRGAHPSAAGPASRSAGGEQADRSRPKAKPPTCAK